MPGFAVLKALCLALAVVLLAPSGRAAPLVLSDLGYARGASVISFTDATVIVFEDPVVPGTLQLFADANTATVALTALSFNVNDAFQAILVLAGPALGDELSGNGAAALGTDDAAGLVQFLFTGVTATGPYAAFAGGAVLVEIVANGLLPFADGFADSVGMLSVTALTRTDVGVIPVPAALPVMAAGLGLLTVAMRRRV